LIAAYSSYGNHIVLEKGDGLAVHHDKERGVVILEYQVHGKAVKTGAAYDNRFVSIVTIKNRKIVRWRDYMAPLPHGRRSTANENGVEVEEPRKAPSTLAPFQYALADREDDPRGQPPPVGSSPSRYTRTVWKHLPNWRRRERMRGRKWDSILLLECNAASVLGKYTEAENLPA